jgi:hypothetical protein
MLLAHCRVMEYEKVGVRRLSQGRSSWPRCEVLESAHCKVEHQTVEAPGLVFELRVDGPQRKSSHIFCHLSATIHIFKIYRVFKVFWITPHSKTLSL